MVGEESSDWGGSPERGAVCMANRAGRWLLKASPKAIWSTCLFPGIYLTLPDGILSCHSKAFGQGAQ